MESPQWTYLLCTLNALEMILSEMMFLPQFELAIDVATTYRMRSENGSNTSRILKSGEWYNKALSPAHQTLGTASNLENARRSALSPFCYLLHHVSMSGLRKNCVRDTT